MGQSPPTTQQAHVLMAASTAGWAEQRQGPGVGQGLPRGPRDSPSRALGRQQAWQVPASRRQEWQELLGDLRRELPAVFGPHWGTVTGSRPPGDKLREGGRGGPSEQHLAGPAGSAAHPGPLPPAAPAASAAATPAAGPQRGCSPGRPSRPCREASQHRRVTHTGRGPCWTRGSAEPIC